MLGIFKLAPTVWPVVLTSPGPESFVMFLSLSSDVDGAFSFNDPSGLLLVIKSKLPT